MKKVIFFNHWHNGDVHISRGIIRKIISKVHEIDSSISFEYSHHNSPDLLADIPNLNYNYDVLHMLNPQDGIVISNDCAYVNTWYDQQVQKYTKKCGILTFDIIYSILNDACLQLWGFSLEDISTNVSDFFPTIDYSKFEIDKCKLWLSQNSGKKILVESGSALSNQANNFSMSPIINFLAKKYSNLTFILSQKEYHQMPDNVFYTADIIQKNTTDLNEISFLSTHCDLIIGRSSGVFTFSIVNENLFQNKKSFISFSHLMSNQNKFWIGSLLKDRVEYLSNIMVTKEYDTNKVIDIIDQKLGELTNVI